jgi:predicted DNA-binding transcriptional regulator YafY
VAVTRATRLFAIVVHLRDRGDATTARQLAERFGVSVRTILRDVATLREAALPVRLEDPPGVAATIAYDPAPPRVSFTAHEAALLIAAGRFLAEMRLLPFTETLASGLAKVRAALPSATEAQVAGQLDTLTFVGVPARAAAPGVRHVLERAWFEGVPITIRYAGVNGTTTRRVRIRSVVMDRRETRVNALDLDKNEDRQFSLDRILHAALVTEPVTGSGD